MSLELVSTLVLQLQTETRNLSRTLTTLANQVESLDQRVSSMQTQISEIEVNNRQTRYLLNATVLKEPYELLAQIEKNLGTADYSSIFPLYISLIKARHTGSFPPDLIIQIDTVRRRFLKSPHIQALRADRYSVVDVLLSLKTKGAFTTNCVRELKEWVDRDDLMIKDDFCEEAANAYLQSNLRESKD